MICAPGSPVRRSSCGFTLIELMVVVTIIVLLSALMIPAFTSIASGSTLTRAEQALADQLALARQEASGRHREVQVRFLWKDGNPPAYRGIQLWIPTSRDVTVYTPLARPVWLPQGTMLALSPNLSPLLAIATMPETTTNFPGLGATKFLGFRFRPGGSTDLPFNTSSNFLTVVRDNDSNATALPVNAAVVQVDPVNGRVRSYRP